MADNQAAPKSLDEINAYAEYLRSQGQPDDAISGYTEYLKSQLPAGRATAMQMAAEKVAVPIAKALDYAGGLARGTLGGIATSLAGKEAPKEAVARTITGDAPTSAEYLKALGVPEGGKLSDVLPQLFSKSGEGLPLQEGGILDITPRGVAGFALDVATDPLTYLSAGASAGSKIKGAGKWLYKLPFREADRAAKKAGFQPLSKVLMESGTPTMGAYTAEDVLSKKIADLVDKQQSIIKQIDDAKIPIDMGKSIKPVEDQLTKMLGSNSALDVNAAKEFIPFVESQKALGETVGKPKTITRKTKALNFGDILFPGFKDTEITSRVGTADIAQQLIPEELGVNALKKGYSPIGLPPQTEAVTTTDLIRGRPTTIKAIKPTKIISEKVLPEIKARPAPTMSEAMHIKTQLSKMAADAYDNFGRLTPNFTPQKAELFKKMAKGFQEQTEDAAKKIGKLDELKKVNSELGTIYNSADFISNEVGKQLRKDPVTAIDAMAASISPLTASTKKAADLSKTMRFKTGAGRRLMNFGEAIGKAEKAVTPAVYGPLPAAFRKLIGNNEE